jgi:uncharacterized protein YndB with AHSA1/START domain
MMPQAADPATGSPVIPEPRRVSSWAFKVVQTVIVDRPPATVFAYRAELAKTPEWHRGVVSASLESMDPIAIGSRCTELRKGAGDSTEDWELEVTDYEPTVLLSIINRCDEWEVSELHQFANYGPATRYTVTADVTGSPVPGGAYQKALVQSLLQLKWALEGVPSHR